MLKTHPILRFLIGAAGAIALLVLAIPINADNRSRVENRLQTPINIAILIQDDLVSHVGNELGVTREFIRSLPDGSEVLIGYITSGSLQVRESFTADREKAAKALRVPISHASAAPYNPYVEVLEGLRKFDSSAKNQNQNVILLISDGLDTSRGFDASSVLHSVDLDRAINEAKRRKVSVYSFFAPAVGVTSRSAFLASYGQSSLNRISHETGGKAFFQGTTDFVTFNPYFDRLVTALNRSEVGDH